MGSDRIFIPEGGGGMNAGTMDFMLGSMMGGGGMGGYGNGAWMNNPIWALAFMRYFDNDRDGRGGRGENNLQLSQIQEQLQTMQGQQALGNAIQGGVNETRALANRLGCDFNAVQAAIQGIKDAVCAAGNQNSMNFMQALNAIGNGKGEIMAMFQNCCCELKTGILNQTNQLDRSIDRVSDTVIKGFCDTNYALRDQTCAIEKAINSSTAKIIEGQRAAEFREMQRDLAAKDAKIAEQAVALNNAEQTKTVAGIVAQYVNPLITGQQALQKEVDGILCKLPETKTIACQDRYIPVKSEIDVPLYVGRGACGYNYQPNVVYTQGF